MSSIDKGVENVARGCDPSARVVRSGDKLMVKVNGVTVVTLADRYGYINESEREAIERGIRNYHVEQRHREEEERRRREEEERRRREEERRRLEAERRRAVAALNREKQNAAALVDASVKAAEEAAKNMRKKLDALALDGGGHDVSKFNAEIAEASKKADAELARVRTKAARLKREIAGFDATQTKEAYDATAKLKGMDKSVTCDLSDCGYDRIKREREALKTALDALAQVEERMASIAAGNGAAARVADMIAKIRGAKIACAADAEKLTADLSGRMSALRSELYDDATSALRAEIDEICGRLEDRSVWRSDESVVYTRSHSVEREVKENAERTIAEYTRLVEADYTVCDRDKALVAIEYAKRVLAEQGDDAADRDALRALIDEAEEYSRRDGELRKHYDDYLDLRGKLEERGELTENLSEFDVFDHETQRNKMIEKLVRLDVEDFAEQTEVAYMAACRVMIDLGFKMLACDLSDGAAYEAIFVKEGRDGAAWQIVAEGDRVTRRLVGIRRASGDVSSVDSRMAAALADEEAGDDIEFVRRLAELSDRTALTGAVSTGDDGSREAIEKNGVFALESEDAEREYDSLVGGETASTQTAVRRVEIYAPRANEEASCNAATERARESRRTQLAARYQKR